jgi:hypothetical protein
MIRARAALRRLGGGLASLVCLSCRTQSPAAVASGGAVECSVNRSLIFDGGPGKDGIPALTNPTLVAAGATGTAYLRDGDRVIGVEVDSLRAVAVPLNIGWWHEIVNLDLAGRSLAITHCPLTGSSLVFDRASTGNATFGVSGLLLLNNLIMYDRTTSESWWPQLSQGARCGPRRGTSLAMFPAVEMTWAGWKALHPTTAVVSAATGYSRDYTQYPYGDYDRPDNAQLLFPNPPLDTRRPPKERVLGVPDGDSAGVAFPFGALARVGTVAAVDTLVGNRRLVVFWDGARQAAAAYRPTASGAALTFRTDSGRIVDAETGSAWGINGVAISGALQGSRLEPVAESFVVYWFAWATFRPRAALWIGAGGVGP